MVCNLDTGPLCFGFVSNNSKEDLEMVA